MSGLRPRPEMSPMKRGEVWWVDFDPSIGGEIQKKRPAIIAPSESNSDWPCSSANATDAPHGGGGPEAAVRPLE